MTTTTTEPPVNVHREGGKVWIEGVPTLGWGQDRECTFVGALEAALKVTDHSYAYDDMIGWSGLAFRVRWYHGKTGQRWCPSSPVGEFPEETEAIAKATGWKLETECQLSQQNPDMTNPVRPNGCYEAGYGSR